MIPRHVATEVEAALDRQAAVALIGARQVGKATLALELGKRRNAEPAVDGGPYPLVVLSHGYPGNRFLIAHFGENLASKGYVVVSIDHTDSTYSDKAAFASTLYNRPLDQLFVVAEMDRRSAAGEGFLSGLIDASRTGIIGYSMGGYGLVNVIGGGFTEASTQLGFAPPNGLLAERQAGTEAFEASFDPRIRAAVAIAPWGMPAGFWDAEGLAGVETPVLFMAGSEDDVSGYENGTRAIFEGAVNAERYLLTFEQARHNAGPHPGAARDLVRWHLRALRRRGVGHDPHEQRRAALRDRLLRGAPQGRRGDGSVPRPGGGRGRGRVVGRRRGRVHERSHVLARLPGAHGPRAAVRAGGVGGRVRRDRAIARAAPTRVRRGVVTTVRRVVPCQACSSNQRDAGTHSSRPGSGRDGGVGSRVTRSGRASGYASAAAVRERISRSQVASAAVSSDT